MSNLNIMTIGGVNCYEQDGVVYLNLEAVARGLGLTRIASSGNEVVRWERVNKYLSELGFVPTSGHGDSYIPENVFYRLAMKANNDVAEKFQALVADEIIPSIRKTGGYQMQAPQMTQLEVLAATAQALVEQERRMNAIEASVSSMDKKLDNVVDVLSAPKTTEAERWQRETHKAITSFCQENSLNYHDCYDGLYEQLEEQAHVSLATRVKNRKDRAKAQGASAAEMRGITKLFCISIDAKLRIIFDNLVKEFKIAHTLKGGVC